MSDTDTRPAHLPVKRHDDLPLTVISEGDALVGRLEMAGSGQVLGDFEGHIVCPGELLIGPNARVRADIQAHDLVLGGEVSGNVIVQHRLKITTTGRLEGDAHVGSLVVQEGGVHFGLLNVYPHGLPERPGPEMRTGLATTEAPQSAGRPNTLAASVDRVKKMWGEIF